MTTADVMIHAPEERMTTSRLSLDWGTTNDIQFAMNFSLGDVLTPPSIDSYGTEDEPLAELSAEVMSLGSLSPLSTRLDDRAFYDWSARASRRKQQDGITQLGGQENNQPPGNDSRPGPTRPRSRARSPLTQPSVNESTG
jgi:hypothetical protein